MCRCFLFAYHLVYAFLFHNLWWSLFAFYFNIPFNAQTFYHLMLLLLLFYFFFFVRLKKNSLAEQSVYFCEKKMCSKWALILRSSSSLFFNSFSFVVVVDGVEGKIFRSFFFFVLFCCLSVLWIYSFYMDIIIIRLPFLPLSIFDSAFSFPFFFCKCCASCLHTSFAFKIKQRRRKSKKFRL